jgi:hypothetical protein
MTDIIAIADALPSPVIGTGRKQDVIVKLLPRSVTTSFGTNEFDFDRLLVWADAQLNKAFATIDGVAQVANAELPTRYVLIIDPRYDITFVMAEVERVAVTSQRSDTPAPIIVDYTGDSTDV